MKILRKIKKWLPRFSFGPVSLPVQQKSRIYEINNFAIDLDNVTSISYTLNSVSIEGAFNPISFYVPEDGKTKEIYGKVLKAWKESK